MAKTYNSMDDFIKDFDKNVKQVQTKLEENKVWDEFGWEIVETIKKRTRQGFGVESNEASKKKLDPLTTKYRNRRKSLKKQGRLSTDATPAKSNLTLQGGMIDSLAPKRIDDGVRVEPTGEHNKDKTKWNADKGRSYLHLSKPEIKRLTKSFNDKLDKILDKIFG